MRSHDNQNIAGFISEIEIDLPPSSGIGLKVIDMHCSPFPTLDFGSRHLPPLEQNPEINTVLHSYLFYLTVLAIEILKCIKK